MFFIKNSNDVNKYTIINNKFFEQILPYIDATYAKIYIFAFYMAQNSDMYHSVDNQKLAEILSLQLDDVLNAWDFFENCNLIKKHRKYNALSDDFSVEFVSLENINGLENEIVDSLEPLDYINMSNESIKKMYENIEKITQIPLSHYEIKQIDSFIVNNSVAYDVIVEAFKFTYFSKKSRSVKDALQELKKWISKGVKTSLQLDRKLSQENERYNLYRKVLRYFGEYRLPTQIEMDYIDKWTIDYNFDYSVVKKALEKSIAIKNPNFKYVDGVLSNWKNSYDSSEKNNIQKDDNYDKFEEYVAGVFSVEIGEKDQKTLKFIYSNYPNKMIVKIIQDIKRDNSEENPVDALFNLMIQSDKNKVFGGITLEMLGDIVDGKKRGKKEDAKKEKNLPPKSKRPHISTIYKEENESGAMEQRVLSKNKLDEYIRKLKDENY